jgi:hypothetical protein
VLSAVCFARLIADPSGLIVDGRRPSIDFANHGDPRPVGNDLTFLFLPHHLYVAKVIAEFGHLPSWDSSGFGGRPMIGNPQSGLFYPPVWIAWSSSNPGTLGWLTVGHLLWGGLGIFFLARGQGLSQWPATVAAGTYQASPYLLAQTFEGHYPHVWAACWFPWAFWALAKYRSGKVSGLLVLPPILALTYLTGHPQEWFLLILALSFWVAADCLVRFARRRSGLRAAVMAIQWTAVLGAGLGLAAIELVPVRAALPWVVKSVRQESGSAFPRNHKLHLLNGLQLVSPSALGGPIDYFGDDNYWESVLSFGVVPIILSAVALASSPDRCRIRGWTILVLLSVWFAGGRQLGFYQVLYRSLPGLSFFRVPARSLFLTSVGMAMLAGFGLEALRSKGADDERWRRFAICTGATTALVVGLLLASRQVGLANLPSTAEGGVAAQGTAQPLAGRWDLSGHPAPRHPQDSWRTARAARRILEDPAFWLTIAAVGTVTAAGCLRGRCLDRPRLADLLGVVALVELAWYGFAMIQVAPAETFFWPDPIGLTLSAEQGDRFGLEPPRVRARDAFFTDLQAVRYGLEKTNINDAFQLQHAAALYEMLYPVATSAPCWVENSLLHHALAKRRQIRQGVFDRMAVSALVSDRVESDPPWPVLTSGTCDDTTYVIQRNPTALPRAYVVPRAEIIADEAASVLSRFPVVDAHAAVLMDHDPLAAFPGDARQSFVPARWLSSDPARPVLEAATEAPGLLVIADTWMPGWSAWVDGRSAPVLRGNHAQRVIALENPGRHVIELEYRPPGFALGCALSALTTTLWGALCAVVCMRQRRRDCSDQVMHDKPLSVRPCGS